MTRKQMLRKINTEIAKARQENNLQRLTYWQAIKWMANRPSMKRWPLSRIIERYEEVQEVQGITTEYIATGLA